jgi:GT2 family glycosyltransferase/2-polyprenyl-3-methyl-5-hydroxy-6-metoxy-1,4-benzoquinol methylase
VSDLYGEAYYRYHCGPVPLERNAVWLGRSGAIADHIVRSLKPRRVLDAGCAMGLLVESLWDKGVEASGIDISSFAISRVRPDLQKQCTVGSITAPFTGHFDLIVCIEVLEHLDEKDGLKAIENMAAATETILFSSDPYDFVEPTHVNVRPILYWLQAFAAARFYPDLTYDASFVASHAMLLRKSAEKPEREDVLQAYTELIRHKIIVANTAHQCAELNKKVDDLTGERNTLQTELQRRSGPIEEFRASVDTELQTLRHELRQMADTVRRLTEYRAAQETEAAAVTEKPAQQEAQIAGLVQQPAETPNLADLSRHWDRRMAELTAALDRVHAGLYTNTQQHAVLERRIQEIYESPIKRTLRTAKTMLLGTANPLGKSAGPTQALAPATPGEELLETFRISFDDPSDGATLSRQPQIPIYGWAIAESGVWALELNLDGKLRIPVEFGRRRPDVSAAFPEYTDGGTSGFSATLDTSSLADGPHFFLVTIHTVRGNVLCRQQDFTLISQTPYDIWMAQNTLSPADLDKMKEDARTLAYQPLISIVTPLYRTPLNYLDACIQSVFDQIYKNWQLCLVDDGSADPDLTRRAEEFQRHDPRVKFRSLPINSGISAATNECLALATGEFVAFLDHDDTLSNTALYEVVKRLNSEPGIDVLYSDEDKITTDNHHFNYFFKPDWSPELFLSCNYICHFLVVRRNLIEKVGGLRRGFEGSQDYDLMLRVVEHTSRIRRIPKILYHWRSHPQSTASATEQKPMASQAGQKALAEHFDRIGENVTVIEMNPGRYRVQYRLPGNPEIRIVIPTGGNRLLKDAVRSVLEKSTYRNYSIVVVDNSSDGSVPLLLAEELQQSDRITVLDRQGQPFNFSALCNSGVGDFKGDYLLFLNDDTTVISPDWLEALLEHAQHPTVGAVGGLLLFPDLKIQHAGVLLGIYGIGGHAFRLLDSREHHYFMFPEMTRNCSAVTGACLMTRRQSFEEVGGFDEQNLPTCFQDVDYCLKLIEKGYRIVYTPYATLLHHESATKNSIAEGYEIEYMRKRWSRSIADDPYYNPNLSRRREDYSLNFEGSFQ